MIDPVCGMEVQSESAVAAWEHAGTTYIFWLGGAWIDSGRTASGSWPRTRASAACDIPG
jgi:hypothetical protein